MFCVNQKIGCDGKITTRGTVLCDRCLEKYKIESMAKKEGNVYDLVAKINVLEFTLQELRAEQARLNQDGTPELLSTQTQLENKSAMCREMEKTIESQEKQNVSLKHSVDIILSEKNNLLSAVSSLKDEIQTLKHELSSQKQENDNRKKAVDDSNSAIHTKEAKIASLEKLNEFLQQEKLSVVTQSRSLEEKLRSSLEQEREKNIALIEQERQKGLQEQEKLRSSLEQEKEKLRSSLEQEKEKLQNLCIEQEKLRSNLSHSSEEHDKLITSLEQEKERLKNCLEESKKNLLSIESERNNVLSEKNKLSSQLEEMRNEAQRTQNEYALSISRMEIDCSTLRKELVVLEQAFDRIKKEEERLKQEHEREMKDVLNDIENKNEKIMALELSVKEYEEEKELKQYEYDGEKEEERARASSNIETHNKDLYSINKKLEDENKELLKQKAHLESLQHSSKARLVALEYEKSRMAKDMEYLRQQYSAIDSSDGEKPDYEPPKPPEEAHSSLEPPKQEMKIAPLVKKHSNSRLLAPTVSSQGKNHSERTPSPAKKFQSAVVTDIHNRKSVEGKKTSFALGVGK